ncbi:MAG: FkbM family methyltransferase [Desulfovibrionaceae bacterium]|nr:FkbM family methyltransferase [Desulfovibrionaceae bacterium]
MSLDNALCIGTTGKWFGFEPDPVGFCAASERIKKSAAYDNYEIIPFGLWHKRSKLRFEIKGQGTHFIKSEKQNTIESDVLSVDEFVEDRRLKKINYIKLDVEGAEFHVLKGAMKTIKKYRPKLAVSLYHQLKDLYSIPLFLKEICVDYEFYLEHHHSAFHETVLYAKPKSI